MYNQQPILEKLAPEVGVSFIMGALGGFCINYARGLRSFPRPRKFREAFLNASHKASATGGR